MHLVRKTLRYLKGRETSFSDGEYSVIMLMVLIVGIIFMIPLVVWVEPAFGGIVMVVLFITITMVLLPTPLDKLKGVVIFPFYGVGEKKTKGTGYVPGYFFVLSGVIKNPKGEFTFVSNVSNHEWGVKYSLRLPLRWGDLPKDLRDGGDLEKFVKELLQQTLRQHSQQTDEGDVRYEIARYAGNFINVFVEKNPNRPFKKP